MDETLFFDDDSDGQEGGPFGPSDGLLLEGGVNFLQLEGGSNLMLLEGG